MSSDKTSRQLWGEAARAAGITIHRSFRGGYPADISEARQSAAENGASEIPSVESHHAASVV